MADGAENFLKPQLGSSGKAQGVRIDAPIFIPYGQSIIWIDNSGNYLAQTLVDNGDGTYSLQVIQVNSP